MDKEKALWFDSLPMKSIDDGFERTCPCGESFWFTRQATSQTSLDSWIDIHFEHIHIANALTAPEPKVKKTEFTLLELYDFEKPIKFSSDGFDEFVETYELECTTQTQQNDEQHSWMMDKYKNIFVFRVPKIRQADLFMMFVPQFSEVKTDYVA